MAYHGADVVEVRSPFFHTKTWCKVQIVRWLRVIFQDYHDRADKSTKFCTTILSDLLIKIRRGAAARNIRSENYPPKLCTIYIKISIIAFTGQMSGPNFPQRYFETR